MNCLPDSHMLIWGANQDARLPAAVDALLNDPTNRIFFSAASIWEITIKSQLGRKDFQVDPVALVRGLLANGFTELPVTRRHALAVASLPKFHKDPFDRLLIAQAIVEDFVLLTGDSEVATYPGPIRKF